MCRRFLFLLLTALAAACADDPTGSGRRLQGSFSAREALLGDGTDLVAAGVVVGLRLTPDAPQIFRLVVMRPALEFRRALVEEGFADTGSSDEVIFLGRDRVTPLEVARVRREGDVVILDLGGAFAGLRRLRLVPSTAPEPAQLAGRFLATRLAMVDSAGASSEIIAAGGRFQLEFADTFVVRGFAPAATLAPDSVSLDAGGAFDTVGSILILGGAFGCSDAFAASISFATRLALQGLACRVAGRAHTVELELSKQ
ncbi:MAG: hypothetical protein HY561_10030 [Gemmatimonadetes bacterium]|nr:hypothetical protein [Gemmatimonadota bacterium]